MLKRVAKISWIAGEAGLEGRSEVSFGLEMFKKTTRYHLKIDESGVNGRDEGQGINFGIFIHRGYLKP